MREPAEIVIVGAGLVGLAAAYHLAVVHRRRGVVVVEAGEVVGLTSRMGTEAYRNWWPDPEMTAWVDRSIDLLERCHARSGGRIGLSRRGYVFVSGDPTRAAALRARAARSSGYGAGPLRRHPGPEPYVRGPADGIDGAPTGIDVVEDPALLRERFPFVGPQAIQAVHARRCGFVRCLDLGTWLLEQVIAAGGRLVRGEVVAIESAGGRVTGVRLAGGEAIAAGIVVAAPGPRLAAFSRLLGAPLPVVCELHGKASLRDVRGVIPGDAPLMLWDEPVTLEWSAAEARALADDPRRRRWLEPLPAGVHFRPRDGSIVMIWTFESELLPPVFPPRFDPDLGEVLIRGLAAMIPGMRAYFGEGPRCVVDGGYYCKAPDNRPLVGAYGPAGAYLCAALSGYGVMGSQAAGEIVAAQIVGAPTPAHAVIADPARLGDPDFQRRLARLDARQGQL
ncbi:MAG: FAD-binding oxidoreductase [Nannocystaceae bacterium]